MSEEERTTWARSWSLGETMRHVDTCQGSQDGEPCWSCDSQAGEIIVYAYDALKKQLSQEHELYLAAQAQIKELISYPGLGKDEMDEALAEAITASPLAKRMLTRARDAEAERDLAMEREHMARESADLSNGYLSLCAKERDALAAQVERMRNSLCRIFEIASSDEVAGLVKDAFALPPAVSQEKP